MRVRLILLIMAVLPLSGCDRSVNDLELYVIEVKARPPEKAAPLPELERPDQVPRQLGRDPFAPLP
jgi:type IV pilus assembly protein PilP